MHVNDPNEFNEENKNDVDLHFKNELPVIEDALGIDEILKWLEE